MGFEDEYDNAKRNNWVINICVGRRPSGPLIEGPFYCAVHLCHALEDRKIEKKSKKKENEGKGRKNRKKKRKK